MKDSKRTLIVDESSEISFEDAAEQLGVSVASIRNWIQTGYIKKIQQRTISRSSWDAFVCDVAGKNKLTKRANKSCRDEHAHDSLRDTVMSRLKSGDPDECSALYENGLSNAHRNREGIYYTPIEIATTFFDFLPGDKSELHFCDPCCGSGNFLLAALDNGFSPENIHGFDTDPVAIEIARHRLAKRTDSSPQDFDLRHNDFLGSFETEKYDVVCTNPPWGKKLPKSQREAMAQRFGTGKSNDTCSLFVSAAIRSLKANGLLGMLLPDSFFNVATFEDARVLLAQNRIRRFVDHGKPFEGLITKAKSFIAEKVPASNKDEVICISQKNDSHFRQPDSFAEVPKHRFNFLTTREEANLISAIFKQPHVTLKDNARWGLGIVTGNNKKHVHRRRCKDMKPVWKGADIGKNSLCEPTNYISNNFSKFQQVANPDQYQAPEKLVYRFISSDLVFFLDDQQCQSANSQ